MNQNRFKVIHRDSKTPILNQYFNFIEENKNYFKHDQKYIFIFNKNFLLKTNLRDKINNQYQFLINYRDRVTNDSILNNFFDDSNFIILFIDFRIFQKLQEKFEHNNNLMNFFISQVFTIEFFSNIRKFNIVYLFITKTEHKALLKSKNINQEILATLKFKQIAAYEFNFSPDVFFILDKKLVSKNLKLPFPDARSNPPNHDYTNLIEIICPGYIHPESRCPNCGAAVLNSKYTENCCNNIQNMSDHLPPLSAPGSIMDIITNYSHSDSHFIRTLNRFSRPILQKTSIQNLQGVYSTLFIQGVTYSLDSKYQFIEPVYLISSNIDLEKIMKKRFVWMTNEKFNDIHNMILLLLKNSPTLSEFVNDKMDALKKEDFLPFIEKSYCSNTINITFIENDNPFQKESPLQAFKKESITTQMNRPASDNSILNYPTKSIPPDSALYDQLLYPVIFWNGKGGIGKLANEANWGTREMKFALKAICLQPPDSFVKQCSVLLDEFLCAGYGRYMQIKVNKTFSLQLQMRQQDEISKRHEFSDKTYGIKTYIPATLTGSPTYWNNVAKNAFYLSMVLGPPTFFITMTENPKWHEIVALNSEKDVMNNSVLLARIFHQKKQSLIDYIKSSKIFGKVKGLLWRDEYQKRGLPHCHMLLWSDYDTSNPDEIDKIITCRLPLPDPNFENEEKTHMLTQLSKTFMTHSCTERCGGITGKCCYGYPKDVQERTEIINERIVFARNPGDEKIVPHSPRLLTLFRAHIDVEPVLSTSSIGYVLKYATKNSDAGVMSFHQIKYCGRPVSDEDLLHKYAATHVVSAPEAYNAIAGLKRQNIDPTINLLPIHEEGKRIIIAPKATTEDEIAQKLDQSMSKLERYFARPNTQEFSNLTYCDYYSFYNVNSNGQGVLDSGRPRFAVKRKDKRIYCAIKTVSLKNHELFALRLLLQEIPARSYADLRGEFDTFWEAAAQKGMVENEQEFLTIINEAIAINRPPSDLRSLVLILYEQGADFHRLFEEFRKYLEKDLLSHDISLESVFISMFQARNIPIPHFLQEFPCLEVDNNSEQTIESFTLNEGQENVVESIKNIIKLHKENPESPYLMFLQGRAGTGKTFTTNILIQELTKQGNNVLVTGTTGIAASQYKGGQTVHSLFGLALDQNIKGNEYKSNIGLHTIRATELISADLIIIDEISMMTIKTAIGVDFTMRFLASEKYGFENKQIDYNLIPPFGNVPILFVGDLLQLPPVIAGSKSSVAQRLITRCEWWQNVIKFALFQPMRSLNSSWTDFLINIGNGNTGDFISWDELSNKFGLKITTDFKEAVDFYTQSINLHEDFPLNRQWICATNFNVDSTNDYFSQKRKEVVGSAGKIYAFTKLNPELDKKEISKFLNNGEKFDFIKHMKFKDIPDYCLEFQIGEPVCLLRNLNTELGIVKNKRCWVKKVMSYSVIVQFEDGSSYTIPRIRFSGQSNGIHFTRLQIPLRPIYAGTVHKSQGMTLERGVIDLRSNFWEHGQLYVALSRFKNPQNVCVLFSKPEPGNDKEQDTNQMIIPVAEKQIVDLVVDIETKCRKNCTAIISQDKKDIQIENFDNSKSKNPVIIDDGDTNDDDYKTNDDHKKDDTNDDDYKTNDDHKKDDTNDDDYKTNDDHKNYNTNDDDIQMIESNTVKKGYIINDFPKLPDLWIQKGYICEDYRQHGLKNFGNTCALNSILQILAHIKAFYQQIESSYYQAVEIESPILQIWTNFLKQMHKCCRPIFCSSNDEDGSRTVIPFDICNILDININSTEQLDVHELFTKIINQVSSYNPEIRNLFLSTYMDINENVDSTVCFIISTENLIPSITHSLHTTMIQQYPNMKFIEFPLILSYYINRVIFLDETTSVKNFIKILIEDQIEFMLDNTQQKYSLFGIIIHIGTSPDFGHYTSFIKMYKEWYYFNDAHVYKVTDTFVQHYSLDSKNKNPVMAFYIRSESKEKIGLNCLINREELRKEMKKNTRVSMDPKIFKFKKPTREKEIFLP